MARSLKRKTMEEKFRCRKCGTLKKADDYYKTCEPDMDLNGRMPTCKECCRGILEFYFSIEGGIIERAFLRTCKKLNILYDKQSILKTHEKMEELKQSGKELDSLLGVYLRNLFANNSEKTELVFQEPDSLITTIEDSPDNINAKMSIWENEWGKGLSYDDYVFLNEELEKWIATHRYETRGEQTLLKEIVYKELELRNARLNSTIPTDGLLKQLQELMKTAKTNEVKKEENINTLGSIIKIMESSYPAEFYKNKDLYKDYDNISKYFDKHVTRPILNFGTNSRDFNFEMEDEKDEEDEDNIDLEDVSVSEEIIDKEE